MRVDITRLPRNDITLNTGWLTLTGLSNTDIAADLSQAGTQFGFEWDLGQRNRTFVHGGIGLSSNFVDPAVFGEALTLTGDHEVRRGLGDLGRWPAGPDSVSVPIVGPRLALLSRAFHTPRTARGSIGITQVLDTNTALHVSGTVRRTEFLPRRDDLNRLGAASGRDQFGRPLFGMLAREGAVLAPADFAEFRRFEGFDAVWALDSDGWSEYRGLTIALEHRSSGLDLFAGYTYSTTRDNWLGAGSGRPDSQLNPFPEGLSGTDWTEGRSDFDAPQSASLAMSYRLPSLNGITLGALYRYRSGVPFTPGFRDGVDANGDGSFRNDPAFVLASPEVSAVAARWGCLTDQIGQFAERNACRGPALNYLDLSVSLGIASVGRGTAEVVIEALNVLEPEIGVRDRALFLVDVSGDLTTDAATGDVEVPLIVNPGFGEILIPQTLGRVFRVGLRIRS